MSEDDICSLHLYSCPQNNAQLWKDSDEESRRPISGWGTIQRTWSSLVTHGKYVIDWPSWLICGFCSIGADKTEELRKILSARNYEDSKSRPIFSTNWLQHKYGHFLSFFLIAHARSLLFGYCRRHRAARACCTEMQQPDAFSESKKASLLPPQEMELFPRSQLLL